MLAKPDKCRGCPLEHKGLGFVEFAGAGQNGVLLLYSGPAEKDIELKKPFQGEIGLFFHSLFWRGGFSREDFSLGYLVSCRPPAWVLAKENPLGIQGMDFCSSSYLDVFLDQNPQIKVIVPLGEQALFRLTGFKGLKNHHGYPSWHARYNRWVVPSLDPKVVFEDSMKEIPTMVNDIAKAIRIAKDGLERDAESFYLEYPTQEDMKGFVDLYLKTLTRNPKTLLAVDIETPYSKSQDEDDEEKEGDISWEIVRASLAFAPGEAITFPYTKAYSDQLERALASSGEKLWWNGWNFDIPRLRRKGHTINGKQLDFMIGWRLLYPDLPKGLGYVVPFFLDLPAWKHLSQIRAEFYSAHDARVTLELGLEIKKELEKRNLWEGFLKDFVDLQSFVLEPFNAIGIGIDEAKREKLIIHYTEIVERTAKDIQPMIPEGLKPWVKKGGYKAKPKEIKTWLKANPSQSLEEAMLVHGYMLDEGGRWNKRLLFNSNSPKQLLGYIEGLYGKSAIPRHKKDGKPTTSSEELKRLAKAKKDLVLGAIVEAGEAQTKLSSFLNSWHTGRDGRVHPTFLNGPATFRLSSQKPNVQNFPSRNEEAQLMRRMIVPGDGWKFICEADFTGIEAIIVGCYADDPSYVRLAKLGVHDFLAAHMMAKDGKFDRIDLSLGDEDLKVALKEAKVMGKKLLMPGSSMCYRDGAKPTVHGSNYGMGSFLMYRNHPEVFGSKAQAEVLQKLYFDIFPSIQRWQKKVVDSCHWTSYVLNCFGYRRHFYATKRWEYSKRTGKAELVWGGDAKKAIATIPQSTAAFVIRKAMLMPSFLELVAEKAVFLQIHDSLVARARDERHLKEVMEKLKKSMCYPIKELGDLVIPVEQKFGLTWGEMGEYERG